MEYKNNFSDLGNVNNSNFSWERFIKHFESIEIIENEYYSKYLRSKKLSILAGIKVLLLPPAYARNECEPSIGLIRLASLLEMLGAECTIYPLTRINEEKLLEKITHIKFDFIGISTTHYTFDNDIEQALSLKNFSKKSSIILGGHGTELPLCKKEEILNDTDIECFINGLGEKPLVDYLYNKLNNISIEKIPGVDSRDNITGSKAKYSEKEYNIFNAISNPKYYPDNISTLYLNTSSHCPMNCVFCSSRNFPGQGVKRITFNILENIISNYFSNLNKLNDISFYDDDLASSFYSEKDCKIISGDVWVKNLCKILDDKSWGNNYSALFRIDTINYSTIDMLINVGFKNFGFGIEHTDDNILRKMRKNISPKKANAKILYILKKNVIVELFFIIFSKWETWDSITKLIVDICYYVDKGALIIYNWGIQPLYGSDIIKFKNNYLKNNNKYIPYLKIIPDDNFISAWFVYLNENKNSLFTFQEELKDDIYKSYGLNDFRSYKMFKHIDESNLNSSTNLINLIRILSMFIFGKNHLSKLKEWDKYINILYDTIFKYIYRNVYSCIENTNLIKDKKEFDMILANINNNKQLKDKFEYLKI